MLRFRRSISLAVHAALVACAVHAAFWLRFDGVIPAEYERLEAATLPLLLLIRLVVFVPFRLFDGSRRRRDRSGLYVSQRASSDL